MPGTSQLLVCLRDPRDKAAAIQTIKDLHAEHGTYPRVAMALGIDLRTLTRVLAMLRAEGYTFPGRQATATRRAETIAASSKPARRRR